MPNSDKNKTAKITLYDVAEDTTKQEKRTRLNKYSTKDTLNLCMKDQNGLSAEMFSLLFAIILAIIVLIEFFGIYLPYKKVEDAEAAYAQREAAYNQLRDKLSDYDNILDQYNRYNYENFDFSIADRNDVLELLDNYIFPHATVRSISLTGNRLVLQLENVEWEDIITIRNELKKDPIFVSSQESQITYDEEHISKYSLTITLKAKDKTAEEGTDNG